MPFRSQAETARGGEIECARISRQFPDHEGKIAAAHPFLQCEKCIFCLFRQHVDDPVPQFGRQARAIGPAIGLHRRTVLNP